MLNATRSSRQEEQLPSSKFTVKIEALAGAVEECLAHAEKLKAHLGIELVTHSEKDLKLVEAVRQCLPPGMEIKAGDGIVKVRRDAMPEMWRIIQERIPQLFDRALSSKVKPQEVRKTMQDAAASTGFDAPTVSGEKLTPARFAEVFLDALAYERTRRELTATLNNGVRDLFRASITALREGERVCRNVWSDNKIIESEREQVREVADVLRARMVSLAKERDGFVKYCESLKKAGVKEYIEHYLGVHSRIEQLAHGPAIFEGLYRNIKKSVASAEKAGSSESPTSVKEVPATRNVTAPVMPPVTAPVAPSLGARSRYSTREREAREATEYSEMLEKRALLRLAPRAMRASLAQDNTKDQLGWKLAQISRALAGNGEQARLDVLLTNKDVKREVRLIIRACPQLLAPGEKAADFVREYSGALKGAKAVVREQGLRLHEVIREKPELFSSPKSLADIAKRLK